MANAAKHKENLVRTTMRLFRKQGYSSTGLQQVLAESGAPKGSLYHYFPNGKESLGEAAVDMAGGLVAEMLTELAAKHSQPNAFVSGYCKVMAGWMRESQFRSGCPIATTMLETAPQSPSITAAGVRAIDTWVRIISGVFERSGMPAREAATRAQLLVAAMEGALLLARIRQSTRPILDVAKLF
jgi:TetR/AcrR family transcriptional repressor of lmrAB and yxaGH operons